MISYVMIHSNVFDALILGDQWSVVIAIDDLLVVTSAKLFEFSRRFMIAQKKVERTFKNKHTQS